MRLLLFCCVLFIFKTSFSQDYPEGTKHIKTILSTVYKKKDTLEHRKLVTYYDENWNVLHNTNTLSSALDKGSKTVTLIDTDKKYVSAIITSEKDTLDYIVYLYDDKGNRTNYYQIRKGDTLNDQKRTYDEFGNNTKLYNKKNGNYYLSFEANYNKHGEVTQRHWYNVNQDIIKIEKFIYSDDGKTKKYFKTNNKGKLELQTETQEIAHRVTKKTYHTEAGGINYGITIIKKKGYYSITENDEKDHLKRLEIFDKKGKLTTSVYVNYEEL